MKYFTKVGDQEFVIEIGPDNQILVDGEKFTINFRQLPNSGVTSLLINNRSLEAVVEEQDNSWQVLIRGEQYPVVVTDERMQRLSKARGSFAAPDGEVAVKSPMPGTIIDVAVSEGDLVKEGDKVVILESMKMENELRASRDGLITQVNVQPGNSVEKEQILVIISDQT